MAESFILNILGSASARPNLNRNASAQVLQVREHLFLIDCGEGTQKQLLKQRKLLRQWGEKRGMEGGLVNLSFQALDVICISHVHGDHVFGIFGLLSTMGLEGRTAPVHIYAPNNFHPLLKFFLSYYGDAISFEIVFHSLKMKEPEVVYENNSLTLTAFPLKHRAMDSYGFLFREKEPHYNVRKESVESLGLTLREIASLKRGEDVIREPGPDEAPSVENGFTRYSGSDEAMVIYAAEHAYKAFVPRSYAYCSDTAPFESLHEWVKGVDLLYHEATYSAENAEKAHERGHSCTVDAARCALEAGAKRLLVGHYSSSLKEEFIRGAYLDEIRAIFPEAEQVNDGDIFEIPFIKLK